MFDVLPTNRVAGNVFFAAPDPRAARIVAALQPGCEEMKREWGNEEETERKGRENAEMERGSLYNSSFFLYFLPLYPFPISKIVSFCCKMLNTALLSRISQKKTWHMRYEKIILGCEKAPQVVGACSVITMTSNQSHFKNLIMESWWIEFSSHAGGDDMAHVLIQLSLASIVFLALLSYYTIPYVLACTTVLLH